MANCDIGDSHQANILVDSALSVNQAGSWNHLWESRFDKLSLEKQTPQQQRSPHIPQIHEKRVEAALLDLLFFPLPEKESVGGKKAAKYIGRA